MPTKSNCAATGLRDPYFILPKKELPKDLNFVIDPKNKRSLCQMANPVQLVVFS